MRTVSIIAASIALAIGTTAAFATPITDAASALTRINESGYVAPFELEFRHGLWTAEATTREGLRVDVLVNAATGAVNAVEEGGGAGSLTAAQVIERLTAAGYTQIRDVEFDDGFWEAEATASNGDRVELILHPLTAAVLQSRLDNDDDHNDAPPVGASVMTADAIRAALTSRGYTRIRDVEFDDGHWEAEATNSAGVRVDLVIDPVTGVVIRETRD